MKIYRRPLQIALLLVILLTLSACGTSGYKALPLTKTFDKSPQGFSFQYPDEWDYTIPVQGILLVGPLETLDGAQPGPLITVLRGLPLSIAGDLSGALNVYLERGPLLKPDNWRITAEESDTLLDGRPARMIEMEGTDSADAPLTYTRVIAVTADNSFVYMVVVNVPVSLRERFQPTLDAIIGTIKILE